MSNNHKELPEGAALISFRRAQGHVNLYGSPFDHQGFVRIDIAGAREVEDIHNTSRLADRERQYITIQMSFAQYAEAISSMNVGDGVPCTLTRLMGKQIEPMIADAPKLDLYKTVADNTARESLAAIDRTIKAVQAQNITQRAKSAILEPLQLARKQLADSLPFIVERFSEELEALSQQARVEVNAYCELAIQERGLASAPTLGGVSSPASQLKPNIKQPSRQVEEDRPTVFDPEYDRDGNSDNF